MAALYSSPHEEYGGVPGAFVHKEYGFLKKAIDVVASYGALVQVLPNQKYLA